MHPLSAPPSAAPRLFGAIAAVSEHPDDPRVGRWIAFVADELGVVDAAPAPAPTPEALAEAIVDPDARQAALERLMIAAMLVPPLTPARVELLRAHAAALGRADEPALVDLGHAAAGRHRALTMGLMRRFPPSERITRAWRRGGLGERWRIVKAMLKLGDAATAARYQALADLPEGTLGHRFVDHCRQSGFALPGERRSFPEPLAFHDMGHALVGAATDIPGETVMAGFEAGSFRERGFTMLEFTLLLFNLGARLPTDAKPEVGKVDLDLLLDAYRRGQAASLDVLAWDPWEDVAEPVEALRRRYGIEA
ncbi:MAG: hypothetical protein H6711_25225 [Myxococcales bacterium]|nr:hypothetical protein [Myxococcales bacterium]